MDGKALVGAFNQEKALVGAFSVIVKSSQTFEALASDQWMSAQAPAQMLPNGHKNCSQTRGWGPGLEQDQDRDRVNRWDHGAFVIQLQVTSYKFPFHVGNDLLFWQSVRERRGWRLENGDGSAEQRNNKETAQTRPGKKLSLMKQNTISDRGCHR